MRERKGRAPNADFSTACCYRLPGLPTRLFAPLFACARVAGRSAHVLEQRADEALIHPVAGYNGPAPRPFPPLDARGPGPGREPPD